MRRRIFGVRDRLAEKAGGRGFSIQWSFPCCMKQAGLVQTGALETEHKSNYILRCKDGAAQIALCRCVCKGEEVSLRKMEEVRKSTGVKKRALHRVCVTLWKASRIHSGGCSGTKRVGMACIQELPIVLVLSAPPPVRTAIFRAPRRDCCLSASGTAGLPVFWP